MANLPESPTYDAGVYQIETTDAVLGGPTGPTNLPLKNLANRTAYLKQHVDALEDGSFVPAGIATQAYVQGELQKLDHKQSVRAATTANITLTGTQTIDGVVLAVGNRVLVKNQSSAAENGIYLVSGSAWTRATDADSGSKLTSGAVVAVEEGTLHGNSRWQLTTDGTISVGTTPLVFADVTSGFAPLASPIFTGNPAAPTPAQFDNDSSLATTEFVQRALGNRAGLVNFTANFTLTAADMGKVITYTKSGAGTASIPAASSVPAGSSIIIQNYSPQGGNLTITPTSGTIGGTVYGEQSSVMLQAGAQIELISSGGTAWLAYNGAGTSLLANTGWHKFASGLILQWGNVTTSSGGSVGLTFPIAFPTSCLHVYGSQRLANTVVANFGNNGSWSTTSGGTFFANVAGSAGVLTVDWLAIGY